MATDGQVTQLRRTYRGEQAWFGVVDRVGVGGLRDGLIDSGVSARVAGDVAFFVQDQMRLRRHQSDATRVRYRRILERLDPHQVERLAVRSISGLFNGAPLRRCL